VSAWIAVICIGIGSLAFRMTPLAFAGRSTSPRTSRLIKDAGAAATAAITVASFDRAAQSGDVVPLAVAGTVGFVLALRGASMLRVVAIGAGLYIALSWVIA
jgi:branched-subunit amino acid transport protein